MVGADTFLYRVSHRHSPPRCSELFSAYLSDQKRAPLRLIFADNESETRGVVARGQSSLNLNLPGTARRLIEAALARGWDPASARRPLELDGWSLL